MRPPKTIIELKDLLKGMEHRERFVFKANLERDSYIEVYCTFLEANYRQNICLTLIDGTKNKPQNKLLDLWDNKNYTRLFELISLN